MSASMWRRITKRQSIERNLAPVPNMVEIELAVREARKIDQLLRYRAAKLIAERTSLEGKLAESSESSVEQLKADCEFAATSVEEAKTAISHNADQLRNFGVHLIKNLDHADQVSLGEKLNRASASMGADVEPNL